MEGLLGGAPASIEHLLLKNVSQVFNKKEQVRSAYEYAETFMFCCVGFKPLYSFCIIWDRFRVLVRVHITKVTHGAQSWFESGQMILILFRNSSVGSSA